MTICAIGGAAVLVTILDGWGSVKKWSSSGKNWLYTAAVVSPILLFVAYKYAWSGNSKGFWWMALTITWILAFITATENWKPVGAFVRENWVAVLGASILFLGYLLFVYKPGDIGLLVAVAGAGLISLNIYRKNKSA